MRWLFTILFCACLAVPTLGQKLTLAGRVTDEAGNPIPFARIQSPDGRNYIANESGFFSLPSDTGQVVLTFAKLGFATLKFPIALREDLFTSVVLQPSNFVFPEQGDADANQIIRKVAEARSADLAPSTYSVQVYTKGVQKLLGAPKRFMGAEVAKILKVDSTRTGILYQSETVSRLYHQPSGKREILLSRRTAGSHEGVPFDRALDLDVNFYDSRLSWKAFGDQVYVSPLAGNAARFYDYAYLGYQDIDGKRIHKIQVKPKKRFDPVFSGYMYVVDGDWQLYSVDLWLNADAGINFVDSLRIHQNFTEVQPHIWRPQDVFIYSRGKVLGFDFSGEVSGIYSDYTAGPDLTGKFMANEVLRVEEDAEQKDATYWNVHRYIMLTPAEQRQYQIRDSLERQARSRYLADSLRNPNRFKPVRFFVAGYKWNNDVTRNSWYISSLRNTGFYNAIEGWGFRLQAGYSKQFNLKQELEVTHNFRYGFGNDKLNSNVQVTFRYDTVRHASFVFRIGTDFLDLNNRGTLNLFYNSIHSLFGGKNYLQLYRSKFISFYTQRELADGLIISTGAEIARRIPTFHRYYLPLIQSAERAFSTPAAPGLNRSLFPVNNALTFETTASYTFSQKYAIHPDGKVYETAQYPTLKLRYRKGISSVFGSAVNYDFLSADLYQDKVRLGLSGFSSFYLSAGKFLNARHLFFPDIHHFTGNQTAYSNPIFPNFHFLNHYSYSTREKYLEAHYEHNFSGLLTRRIPLLRKLKLEEIVGGAYLGQPNATYKEFYFGFQRLMVRADFGIYWPTNQKMLHAFRVFYGF